MRETGRSLVPCGIESSYFLYIKKEQWLSSSLSDTFYSCALFLNSLSASLCAVVVFLFSMEFDLENPLISNEEDSISDLFGAESDHMSPFAGNLNQSSRQEALSIILQVRIQTVPKDRESERSRADRLFFFSFLIFILF